MFWNKKPKLPITLQDQIWVEESLSFLKESIGEEILLAVKTIAPSKEFFERDFDGSESDAEFILKKCADLMHVALDKISLAFYSDENHYLDDGTLLSSSADVMGRSSGAAGTYKKQGGKTTIRVDRGQLKHPESLIATISHELAHEKLLGEKRIIENDEYLTDLTAIAFGFGIFIANTKFQFSSGKGDGFGWEMQSQGYLPEQVTAYAMSSLALKRRERNQDYKKYLDASVVKHFEQSLQYLQSNENQKDSNSFWVFKPVSLAKEVLENDPIAIANAEMSFSPEELKTLQENLFYAVSNSNDELTKTILKQGVSPNFQISLGNPMEVATRRDDIAMMQLLLQYGADVNYVDDSILATSPLIAACKNGNILMMKELLALGADIHHTNHTGEGVLQIAIKNGTIEMVSFILENGAHIETRYGYITAYVKTPLCIAVENNDEEMVSFLVEKGAKTKAIKKLPRHDIHPKMVKFLKSKKYL